MATAKNDITHDLIKTKVNSDKYRENLGNIFGKSKLELKLEEELKAKEEQEKGEEK